MKYYFDAILPYMKAGIALPFEDGMWGAGIFGEMEFLRDRGKPIWEIRESGIITFIHELDQSKKLSIDETKKRVYA